MPVEEAFGVSKTDMTTRLAKVPEQRSGTQRMQKERAKV